MAHHIETHNNEAAAVFARQSAWHELGTTLTEEFTAEQAMEVAHLGGWNVRKTPLTTTDITDNGVTTIDIPGKYATIRTNPFTGAAEPLGVVGSSYTPIQNEQHAGILNTLVDESGAHFDTAGSLRNGRNVFVSMKLPQHILIGGQDQIDVNLVALNSHDGSSAFKILVTPIRVVCANTQAAALRNNKASYSIRHTMNYTSNLTTARQTLDMTFTYLDEFQTAADRMIETTVTNEEFEKLMKATFKTADELTPRASKSWDDRFDTLSHLWHDADTNKTITGTRWGAYQVVTEFVDHFTDSDNRAEQALTNQAQVKRRAFDLLAV